MRQRDQERMSKNKRRREALPRAHARVGVPDQKERKQWDK